TRSSPSRPSTRHPATSVPCSWPRPSADVSADTTAMDATSKPAPPSPAFIVRPLSERDGYVYDFYDTDTLTPKLRVAEAHRVGTNRVHFRPASRVPLVKGGYRRGYSILPEQAPPSDLKKWQH